MQIVNLNNRKLNSKARNEFKNQMVKRNKDYRKIKNDNLKNI